MCCWRDRHLAEIRHAEAIGERRVQFARLGGDAMAPLRRQVLERPHVVHAVGETGIWPNFPMSKRLPGDNGRRPSTWRYHTQAPS